MSVHYIKVREIGSPTWSFLGRMGTYRLKMHASRFDTIEKAQAVIDENTADNPGWEWKVTSA